MKRKAIYGLLALVLILALVTPGCLPKRDTATTNPTTDTERIAALESKVSQLQSKIASLPETGSKDYSADIDKIYDSIDGLQAQLDDILDQVDETLAIWEEQQGGQSTGGGGTENITTWSWVVTLTPKKSADANKVSVVSEETSYSPWRIREADDYTIWLTLRYTDTAGSVDVAIDNIFYPKAGDRVYVDETNTFLDPVTPPFVAWDTEVYTRGTDKYARYIRCYSDYYTVEAGKDLKLKLMFTLNYK